MEAEEDNCWLALNGPASPSHGLTFLLNDVDLDIQDDAASHVPAGPAPTALAQTGRVSAPDTAPGAAPTGAPNAAPACAEHVNLPTRGYGNINSGDVTASAQPGQLGQSEIVEGGWGVLAGVPTPKEGIGANPVSVAASASACLHVVTTVSAGGAELATAAEQPGGVGNASAQAPVRGKRGRKRKPRMPELQAQLESLAEQFSKLHQENEFLKNKLKVLERVVPYRDESAAALTQLLASAAAAQAAADQRSKAAAAGAGAACGESPYSSSGESDGSDSDYASDEEDEEEEQGGSGDDSSNAGRAKGLGQSETAAAVGWGHSDVGEAGAGLAGTLPGSQCSSLPTCSGSSSSAADGGSQRGAEGGAVGSGTAGGRSRGRSSGGGGAGGGGGGGHSDNQRPASRAPQLPARPSGSKPPQTMPLKPDPGQKQHQHQQQSSASLRTERQLQSSLQQQQQQATSAAPQQPKQPAVLALCPTPDGESRELTAGDVEELRRVTPEQFRQLWKHMCMQLGVLVAGAEVHGPGSPPFARLERFLAACLAYCDKISLLAPACFVHSMYTNIETGQSERPPDSFWMTCARALQLTPAQLEEVTSLASVYEQNVVPVVQQRLQLAARLSDTLAAATAAPTTGGETLTALSEVDALAEQLQRNVLKEHQAHWDIGDFLCSSVLTRFQVAKALTVCFPHIPDGVAMLHAFKILSEQLKQQQQQQQQQAASTCVLNSTAAVPARGPQQAQAVAAARSAATPLAGSQQTFPTLAGLLVCHLPQLAAWTLAAAPGAAAGAATGTAPMQPHAVTAVPVVARAPTVMAAAAPAAGAPVAAAAVAPAAAVGALPVPMLQPALLQGFLGMLQPAQLQGLVAMLQPAQLQALLQSLSPAQMQQLLTALQPAQLQAVLTALQPAQLHGALSVLPPDQLPALLGKLPPVHLQSILAVLREQQR
ncbi:hypothetical protein HYH02_013610 [Chlamydomonas schloesseri]|uniref:Magnesium transporter MgtE intracellular domain-containing protein n=1 Tax=Chlamydomonas schloesseri TaxID=2026947 RepID=A0A835SS07_9CHLO|nr:hypothetical protein HYH02_013610 [Chlamydomonas schloesseri]|eukprot:KAG2430771.1 hypothetical protein HYH02_013610 [Chlamydomonas schloesseri]